MKCKKYKQVGPLVQSLIGHIKEFITDYVQTPDLIPQSVEINNQRNCSSEETSENSKSEEPTLTPHDQRNDTSSQEMITDFRQAEPETKEVENKNSKKEGTVKLKEEEVLEACEELRKLTMEKFLDQEAIEEHVNLLGRKFTEVVDVLLVSHIKVSYSFTTHRPSPPENNFQKLINFFLWTGLSQRSRRTKNGISTKNGSFGFNNIRT